MKNLRFAAVAALLSAVLVSAAALATDAAKTPVATTPAAAKPAAAAPAIKYTPTAKAAAADKAVLAIDAQIAANKANKSASDWKMTLLPPKVVSFDPAKKYFVRMTTSEGVVLIRLLPESAPMHATNFIYLSRLGFYDGIVFHRVITKFMAQAGCPLGTGTGGPGYQFDGELDPKVKHDRPGLLSMANAGPGTDGSQFFLTFVATPWLDGKHTIFGEVVEGMDVVTKLELHGSKQGSTTKKMTIDKCAVEVQ